MRWLRALASAALALLWVFLVLVIGLLLPLTRQRFWRGLRDLGVHSFLGIDVDRMIAANHAAAPLVLTAGVGLLAIWGIGYFRRR